MTKDIAAKRDELLTEHKAQNTWCAFDLFLISRIEELEAWKKWATEFVILDGNCPDCMRINYDCICDALIKGEGDEHITRPS